MQLGPQIALLQARPLDEKHDRHRNDTGYGCGYDPEQALFLVHVAYVLSVHAQVPSHKRERQKNDGRDGEDHYCFVVRLSAYGDGLTGLRPLAFRLIRQRHTLMQNTTLENREARKARGLFAAY